MKDYIVTASVMLQRAFLVTAADERRAGELVVRAGEEEERDGEAVEMIGRPEHLDTDIIEIIEVNAALAAEGVAP